MATETRRNRQAASSTVSNVITGNTFTSSDETQPKETPRDFLHSCGANKLLLDAMSLVLQRRPKDPIGFLSDHFGSLIEPKSSFQNAHEKIRLVHYKKNAFESILVDVYEGFKEKRGKKSGLRGVEHNELIQFLVKNTPISLSEKILKQLVKPEKQSISFSTFGKDVITVLIFEDFIKTAKTVYRDIDFSRIGRADRDLCFSFLSEIEGLFSAEDENEGGMNNLKSLVLKYSETNLMSSSRPVMSLDEFVKMAVDNFIQKSV